MSGGGARAYPVFATLLLAACAGQPAQEPNPDPFERINRVTFAFNDAADKALLKPAAQVYEALVPDPVRHGVGNFFDNLTYPVVIVNDVLQGKLAQGGQDLARLALNTTVGLGGLFDPATQVGLAEHDEDFGQTLGVWGLPPGPFLMVPVLGPYTLRSGVGDIADSTVNPLVQYHDDGQRNAAALLFFIHDRYTLFPAEEQMNQAYDRYAFLRDTYLQNRRYLRYDGNPPVEEDPFFDEEFDEEF